MRLFIAIPVPEALNRYCQQMQRRFEGLKKTKDFHLTIQFLGGNIESSDEIIEALSQIEFEPLEIEMGDIVSFGTPQKPRGIWIECRADSKLSHLADRIRESMSEIGYKADKPFKAHITLGRYKNTPKKRVNMIPGEKNVFQCQKFELIESKLSESGSNYEIIKAFSSKEN